MFYLIYGGSGSGKSAYAEKLLARLGKQDAPRCYVATMLPADGEAKLRIARHRAEREGKGFITIERYLDLAGLEIPERCSILLECLGNLTANEMFSPGGAGKETCTTVLRGLDSLERRAENVIVVSNDVFSDGVEYAPETVEYCRTLAVLHRELAARSASVVETVCGIPIHHKNESTLS